jgi:hypothetical protein
MTQLQRLILCKHVSATDVALHSAHEESYFDIVPWERSADLAACDQRGNHLSESRLSGQVPPVLGSYCLARSHAGPRKRRIAPGYSLNPLSRFALYNEQNGTRDSV